jgi:NAD+ synthase
LATDYLRTCAKAAQKTTLRAQGLAFRAKTDHLTGRAAEVREDVLLAGPRRRDEVLMFHRDILRIDVAAEAARIEGAIREQVLGTLKKRGVVVGLSGGVDSSVVATLCVRALGKDRVFALFMPERHSSPESLALGQLLATHLGVRSVIEDIAPALEGAGCYARQHEAIRTVFPEYGPDWRCKITLPSILDADRLNVFQLVVQSPDGTSRSSRMPMSAYLQLVAATNFKQRTRKMLEYYHADRLNYAVAGTPNRLEYDQGFFVKQGDGAADFKPIAHLYKTQVYALAEFLGVPEEIRRRPPTTDTYSMSQTQEEFFFALPYDRMDLCLYARNHGVPASEVAPVVGLTPQQVERVFRDIDAKRRATKYQHLAPLLVEPVEEV